MTRALAVTYGDWEWAETAQIRLETPAAAGSIHLPCRIDQTTP